jgi:hypothetical protein
MMASGRRERPAIEVGCRVSMREVELETCVGVWRY